MWKPLLYSPGCRLLIVYCRPQRSCGQGNVFTGVCLSTGGCLPQCMLGCHTPLDGEPPGWRNPPWDQVDPPTPDSQPLDGESPPGPGRPPDGELPQMENPPGTRQTPQMEKPPPPGSRLQHTVYERPVRILLECILVILCDHLHQSYGFCTPID